MQGTKKAESKEITIDLDKLLIPGSIIISGIIISAGIFFGLRSIDGVGGGTTTSLTSCSSSAPLSRDCLVKYAEEIDLDEKKFAQCLDEGKYAETITNELTAGSSAGVQGTPSLYLAQRTDGDKLRGFYIGPGLAYADFAAILDYAQGKSIEDAQKFWQQRQLDALAELETQARAYYASAQGGSLTGETLETEVKKVIDQQTASINTLHGLKDLSIGDGVVKGGDSDLILMEFSDFECPYCKQFYSSAYTQIVANYVDTGKVTFVFRDFPLEQIHPNARRAAEAGRCAEEQGKFYEYHDKIFAL